MAERQKRNAKLALNSFVLYPAPSKATKYEGVSGLLAIAAVVFAILHHNVLVAPYQELATDANAAIYKFFAFGCAISALTLYFFQYKQ